LHRKSCHDWRMASIYNEMEWTKAPWLEKKTFAKKGTNNSLT